MKLDPLAHRVAARTRKEPPVKVRADTPLQAALRPLFTGDLNSVSEALDDLQRNEVDPYLEAWAPKGPGTIRVRLSGRSTYENGHLDGGTFSVVYPNKMHIEGFLVFDSSDMVNTAIKSLPGGLAFDASAVKHTLESFDFTSQLEATLPGSLREALPEEKYQFSPRVKDFVDNLILKAADINDSGALDEYGIDTSPSVYLEWGYRRLKGYKIESVKKSGVKYEVRHSSEWSVYIREWALTHGFPGERDWHLV